MRNTVDVKSEEDCAKTPIVPKLPGQRENFQIGTESIREKDKNVSRHSGTDLFCLRMRKIVDAKSEEDCTQTPAISQLPGFSKKGEKLQFGTRQKNISIQEKEAKNVVCRRSGTDFYFLRMKGIVDVTLVIPQLPLFFQREVAI